MQVLLSGFQVANTTCNICKISPTYEGGFAPLVYGLNIANIASGVSDLEPT